MDKDARCKTCSMQRGEHDRACVQEQLFQQKLAIVKKLVALRRRRWLGDFATRIAKEAINLAIETAKEA